MQERWGRRAYLAVTAAAGVLATGVAARLADGQAVLSTAPADLVPTRTASVTEIIDGDTVILDDGREVRLIGLQAPKLALGREGFVEWPLAEEARRALAELTLGRSVSLAYGGRTVDRHGRELAHLIRDDGLWVQGAMLLAGMARVYSFADTRTGVGEMLNLERDARAADRGIWDHPFYAVRSALETPGYIDTFQLVEATVRAADDVRGRVFLNFGEDWRSDFTVTVARGDVSLFDSAGLDLLALAGHRIRVRGWITERNGPMIEATHPEQIEVLGTAVEGMP